jgi:hypothetical protein
MKDGELITVNNKYVYQLVGKISIPYKRTGFVCVSILSNKLFLQNPSNCKKAKDKDIIGYLDRMLNYNLNGGYL